MRQISLSVVALCLLSATLPAQTVVYFSDSTPASGSTNAFPFNASATTYPAGYTTFCVYPAATLQAAGVAPNQSLVDLAFVPTSTSTGASPCVLPLAKNWIGNMVATPTSTGWVSNLNSPTLLWDSSTDGTLSFPWTFDTWTSIPMRGGAAFHWDGVSDIGIQISRGAGWTGGPTVRTALVAYTRHGTGSFDPAPGTATTTTGTLGMKIRLTFSTPFQGDGLHILTTGSGVGDLAITLNNLPPGTSEGFIFPSLDLNTTPGPFFGMWPDGLTLGVFSVSAAPGNPLHFLDGYPGLFPQAPFTAPPGTLSFLSGQTWRFVSICLAPGYVYLDHSSVVSVNW